MSRTVNVRSLSRAFSAAETVKPGRGSTVKALLLPSSRPSSTGFAYAVQSASSSENGSASAGPGRGPLIRTHPETLGRSMEKTSRRDTICLNFIGILLFFAGRSRSVSAGRDGAGPVVCTASAADFGPEGSPERSGGQSTETKKGEQIICRSS